MRENDHPSPAEVMRRIRRLELYINRFVASVLAGEYLSVFKGRGIEFDQVREYQAGDDVRTIDWNVTARMNRPFVKQFVEERELTVMLLVDLSLSTYFGTLHGLKRDLAAEFCAAIAFAALRSHDRVGLVLFSDRVEHVVPPRKGRRHVLRLLRDLLSYKPLSTGTNIVEALDFTCRMLHRTATLFLVSDFYAPDFRRALRLARLRHDVIAVLLTDRREWEVPEVGLVWLRDPEGGAEWLVDTHDEAVRQAISQHTKAHLQELQAICRSARVDLIALRTDQPLVPPLVEFFRQRQRRRARTG